MKHDPSLYIGLSQDGFLPPERADPFDPKSIKFSDTDELMDTGPSGNWAFGIGVVSLLILVFGFLVFAS
jgi:hypothetical protein